MDAAKRQLETAIRMFFLNGDPVSIHTLAYAAHTLLVDLGQQQNIRGFIKGVLVDSIIPEMRDEYIRIINEAGNFFKHANRDPNELLQFNLNTSGYLMWDAVVMYQQLSNESTPLMVALRAWFYAKNPAILDQRTRQQLDATGIKLDPKNRGAFLEFAHSVEEMIYSSPTK